MSHALATNFELRFAALPGVRPHVLRFQGTAAMNALYQIDATVVFDNRDLESSPMATLLSSPVTLSVKDESAAAREGSASGSGGSGQPGQSAWRAAWHGLPARLSIGARIGGHTLAEIAIGPALAALAGQFQNRVHLDQTSLDIVKDSLRFGGLTPDLYRFEAAAGAYPKREFVLQYEESLLDFLWRTLQREGLALHFDQAGGAEVAVITDSPERRRPVLDAGKELALSCAPASGLRPGGWTPQAHAASVVNQVPPRGLLLKDYDWEDPNRPLQVRIPVDPNGRGEVHLWGENFATEAEGLRLGSIIREQHLSAAEILQASTTAPGVMPGLTVALVDHPVPSYNDRWLITATRFEGTQSGRLSAALGLDLGREDASFRNGFEASRLSKPFRPARTMPRAKVAGSLTAWIDGAGSGAAPEMDAYGRYKVLLPLDVSGRDSGKASAWIRMSQPFIGRSYGQNFPLTPGAEVLLTFVDGNPDRPVISGAMPNAENFSLVNSGSSDLSGIGTKGGGGLLFHDKPGSQKVALTSGSNRGGFVLSSSSPTEAAITADYANLMAAGVVNLISDSSLTSAGSEFSFAAGSGGFQKVMTILNMAKSAVDTGISIYEKHAAKANQDEASDSTPVQVADVVAKGANCFDALTNGLFTLFNTFRLIQKASNPNGILLPHENLVAINANGQGASGSFKAKKSSALTLAMLSNLLSKALDIAGQVSDLSLNASDVGEANNSNQNDIDSASAELTRDRAKLGEAENKADQAAADMAEAKARQGAASITTDIDQAKADYDTAFAAYNKAKDEVDQLAAKVAKQAKKLKDLQDFDKEGLVKARKRVSAAAALGSESVKILADLVSFVAIIEAGSLPYGPTRGVLIKNDDSYVSVKSKGYTAVSAEGPLILESSATPLADLLRLGLFDLAQPATPIKPETLGNIDYQTGKAVLITSMLARMMAEEVSLRATGAILAEGGESIQLVAGYGTAGIAKKAALAPLIEAANAANNALRPKPTPATLAAHHAADRAYHAADTGLAYDEDHAKGILLKTEQAAMPATIHTAKGDSKIELLQGVATRDVTTGCRLSLSSDAATLQQNGDTILNLSSGKEAKLAAGANAKLVIKENDVSLTASATAGLTLTADSANIKVSKEYNLEVGASSIKVDASHVHMGGALYENKANIQKLG
jgi:type VI secretion system VgrG family protein